MTDEPLRVLVVHTGTTTSRISSRLVARLAALTATIPVVVDFEAFEDKIKGIQPNFSIVDDVEFRSTHQLNELIAKAKEAVYKPPQAFEDDSYDKPTQMPDPTYRMDVHP